MEKRGPKEKRWTDEEIRTLHQLNQEGCSDGRVAEIMGLTTYEAKRKRKMEGLPSCRSRQKYIGKGGKVMHRTLTTSFFPKIRELHAQGMADSDIAKALDIGDRQVFAARHSIGLQANYGVGKRMYMVYDSDTDELLVSGSAAECADFLGIKITSFYSARSRFESGKYKSRYQIYKVDKEAQEEAANE